MKRKTDIFAPFDSQYIYMSGGEKRKESKPTPFPPIDGRRGYKCDLHIHTTLSDGKLSAKERIDEARENGLDVIALTDHSPFAWGETPHCNDEYDKAAEYGRKVGVTVVKGVELTCCKPVGHVGILFAHDTDDYHFPSYPISEEQAEEALKRAHEKGTFVVYNHPGWPDHDSALFDFQERLIEDGTIEGMEVMSSHEFYPVAIDYCSKYSLTPLSASDLHNPCSEEYDSRNGRNYTIVYADSKLNKHLKEALREKRTIAVAGNIITGREGLLKTLIQASISVRRKKLGSENYLVEVTNYTDIEYDFEGETGQRFSLPAHDVRKIYCGAHDLRCRFFVRNAFIESQRNLTVSLSTLFGLDEPPTVRSEETDVFALPDNRYICTLYEGQLPGVAQIEHGRTKPSRRFETTEATNRFVEGYESYGLKFERTINIPQEDSYSFSYATNGLVRIYIDHRLAACNDSMCRITSDTVTLRMTKGWHLIQIYYVQDFCDETFIFSPLFNT